MWLEKNGGKKRVLGCLTQKDRVETERRGCELREKKDGFRVFNFFFLITFFFFFINIINLLNILFRVDIYNHRLPNIINISFNFML